LHRELDLPADARLVATIGQLGLRKGTDTALGAAWQVAGVLAGVHWLIVGERTSSKQESRDFESLLQMFAADPPLVGRVHFLGARVDIAELLAECDLLVHAARQEPLGRVLLEGAACGLAIVATDVGGTREIFPSAGDQAILVRPDDRTELADAVAAILSDGERRQSLGHAARGRAEQAFDIRDAAQRLIEQYQRTLAGAD
jgi:glycosyltransferase involved in cell wall biosynthesis